MELAFTIGGWVAAFVTGFFAQLFFGDNKETKRKTLHNSEDVRALRKKITALEAHEAERESVIKDLAVQIANYAKKIDELEAAVDKLKQRAELAEMQAAMYKQRYEAVDHVLDKMNFTVHATIGTGNMIVGKQDAEEDKPDDGATDSDK